MACCYATVRCARTIPTSVIFFILLSLFIHYAKHVFFYGIKIVWIIYFTSQFNLFFLLFMRICALRAFRSHYNRTLECIA